MKRRIINTITTAALCAALLSGSLEMKASGEAYKSIQDTHSPEVVRLTEEIGARYNICPEVLQALIFYESTNRRTAVSRGGCIGYMQVSPKWQRERMGRLGVCDLTDGYGNILVGTDYLAGICAEYGDIYLALTAYNQGDAHGAQYVADSYAGRILELSGELEKMHGK